MTHSLSLARGDARSPRAPDPTAVANTVDSRDPIAMSQAPNHTHERNMQWTGWGQSLCRKRWAVASGAGWRI